MDAGEALGPMTFTGIFIPGVNNHDYLANADCRVETYFVTPPLKPELGLRVTFLLLCNNYIRTRHQGLRFHASLCSVYPPADHRLCSLAQPAAFAAQQWLDIPVLSAQNHPPKN